jgi:DNA repair photolyase
MKIDRMKADKSSTNLIAEDKSKHRIAVTIKGEAPVTDSMGSNAFGNDRAGKGTREWSDFSYNICLGCEHECLYCYARMMRSRFDASMRPPGAWGRQQLNPTSRLAAEVSAKGLVMFPTSHDIMPSFLPACLTTIKNLLVRNKVLIVSKPHLPVVRVLCRELVEHKRDLLFRLLSIGSLRKSTCAFWEPGAPPPGERFAALKHAFGKGFATSVSVEPMLEDLQGTCDLVAKVQQYVTDTVWIGKMQRIPRKLNAHVEGFDEAAQKIKAQQSDEKILALVNALEGNPKVRWKDSVKAVLEEAATRSHLPIS